MDRMEMNFCRRCGSTLSQQSASYYICKNNHKLYVNAVPTTGTFFLTDDNHLLLSVRGIEPLKGKLDTFGGFVENGETAERGAERELQEELGLSPDQYDPPVFLSTEVALYPFSGEDRSILGTFFWSRLKPGVTPIAADDVAGIVQIPLADIDLDEIGGSDVKAAIKKLQKLLL